MVTTINIGNKDGYQKLFREATEKLRAKGLITENFVEVSVAEDEFNGQSYYVKNADGSYELAENWGPNEQYYILTSGINTLEDYFCNIDHLLGSLDGDEAEYYEPKYIMLPLDEEPFKIDANARTITVPTNFRRNGVSVQGDEIAEMLYFTIDRYFDAVDFDTADIYIQWETPTVNGKNERYLTQICSAEKNSGLKELTRYPGKILFGWPLTSKVTATPGALKFSVRIIKKNETTNTIAYSFSTLTATVNINPGLNFDMTSEDIKLDNYYTLFQSAITNSQNTEGPDADMPSFIYDLPVGEKNEKYQTYLVNDASGVIWTDGNDIKVSAVVEDTGTITYKWYYQKDESTPRVFLGYEGKGLRPNTDNPIWNPVKIFLPIATTSYLKNFFDTYNNKVTYYNEVIEENGELGYEPYIYNADTWESDKADLYMRLSQLNIQASVPSDEEGYNEIIGFYYCVAVNRVNNKEKSNTSRSIIIPGTKKLDLTTNLQEHRTESGELAEADEPIVYEQGYIGESGSLEVSVKADTGDTNSVLSYEWTKSNTIDGIYESIEDNIVSEGSNTTLTISENGYYKMKGRNMVNLDVLYNETAPLKITKAPEQPEIIITTNENQSIIINPNTTDALIVEVNNIDYYSNPLNSEELIYTWHVDTDNNSNAIEFEIVKSNSQPDANKLHIEELTDVIGADEVLGAIIYCTVKNRIGSMESAPSNVSDKFVILT